MSVTADLGASWVTPRRVIRRLLAQGRREDRAVAFLMIACGLIFVSEWPTLARAAAADPAVSLEARMGGAMLAWLAFMPLALYGVAALSHLLAKLLGGGGTFYGARLALFWALLASSPAWLLWSAAATIAPGPVADAVGAAALAGLVWLWLPALIEAERGADATD